MNLGDGTLASPKRTSSLLVNGEWMLEVEEIFVKAMGKKSVFCLGEV